MKENKKTIFLCGFMGCGKSTAGRFLARKLECPFTDTDEFIENRLGMDIPRIFSEKGEKFFRDAETEAIRELSCKNGVIACGGGAMMRETNAETANSNGIVIYIDVGFETCYNRIKDDLNRPLVQNNTKDELHSIYNDRIHLYKKHSSVTVNGDGTPEFITDEIIRKSGIRN